MKIITWGLIRTAGFFLFLAVLMTGITNASGTSDQLVVFLQKNHSDVEMAFIKDLLPEIEALAKEMNLSFYVADAEKGLPEEVTITPLILFQNHRGRSVYQGRYNTVDRIRNFIRTSRYVPQQKTGAQRDNLLIMQDGRAKIWAKIKVTPLTGHLPEGYDEKEGEAEARKYITEGFSRFRMTDQALLGRADRGFYLDVYPWRSEDGVLFLSLAVYSQFHCKEPVFRQMDIPVKGPWDERETVCHRAADMMEHAVLKIVQSSITGDGFDPVPDSVPVCSWSDIGFSLPAPPEKSVQEIIPLIEIPKNWVLAEQHQLDAPAIQFRFPPPLDQYAGEVIRGTAKINLPDNWKTSSPKGYMEMDMNSVTMGIPDLDKALKGSIFLNTKKFPTARFDLASVHGDPDTFGFGKLAVGTIAGTLTLKGIKMPFTVPMEMEPVLDQEGHPLLLIRGSFSIDLSIFDIEGADGPAPQKNTLVIDANLKLVPQK